MDPQKHEMKERRLIRWLLIATLALLICVLGLQVRQMLRSGSAPDGGTLTNDAAPSPALQSSEPRGPSADGVSGRKAALIEDVRALNPALSAGDLSALSEKELEQLCETGAPGLPIGLSAAAYAAEVYAGTLELDSVTWDAEPELDETPARYEMELHHITLGDFDYEVDAYTGEVLKGVPSILQTASVPPGPSGQSGLIGEDAARDAAFAHAGVREADALRVKCELDWEDGIQIYDVEFDAGGLEYEYEIDAASGTVLKAETGR